MTYWIMAMIEESDGKLRQFKKTVKAAEFHQMLGRFMLSHTLTEHLPPEQGLVGMIEFESEEGTSSVYIEYTPNGNVVPMVKKEEKVAKASKVINQLLAAGVLSRS